jgi:hypothetical protein
MKRALDTIIRPAVVAVLLVGIAFVPARSQDTFSSISTVYFDVKYQYGQAENEVRNFLDHLQNERATILQQLGIDSVKKIDVKIYSSVGRFLVGAGIKQSWRGAIYTKEVLHLQPIQALVQRGIVEESVSYELALAMLDPVKRRGCPEWLCEAYAVHHSGEMKRYTPPYGVRLASFSDLNQDIQEYPNPPQRNDVHYILGETMQFFIDRYGQEKAFGLYKEFDGMRSVETVFKKHFNEEYGAVERAWASGITTRPLSPK